MKTRAPLLIRCSILDARQIRSRAEAEYRTVNGYILNIVARSLLIEEKFANMLEQHQNLARIPTHLKRTDPKTAVLVRCSPEQAARIRAAARRRGTTISGFVLHCLRRTWNVADQIDIDAG